jgi:hypothetical protein
MTPDILYLSSEGAHLIAVTVLVYLMTDKCDNGAHSKRNMLKFFIISKLVASIMSNKNGIEFIFDSVIAVEIGIIGETMATMITCVLYMSFVTWLHGILVLPMCLFEIWWVFRNIVFREEIRLSDAINSTREKRSKETFELVSNIIQFAEKNNPSYNLQDFKNISQKMYKNSTRIMADKTDYTPIYSLDK